MKKIDELRSKCLNIVDQMGYMDFKIYKKGESWVTRIISKTHTWDGAWIISMPYGHSEVDALEKCIEHVIKHPFDRLRGLPK